MKIFLFADIFRKKNHIIGQLSGTRQKFWPDIRPNASMKPYFDPYLGPVHPSAKPPPPPPNKAPAHTNLNRQTSRSFNQTIGHGPQGRPQLHRFDQKTSRVSLS